MNKAEILHAIDALQKAVKSGNKEWMYRCAYSLKTLFEREVPEPLEGYDAALMRFKMAEAMAAFLLAIGEHSQAGTLRNRITAHYQAVRKSKDYSVPQKHELKEILKRIKDMVPSQKSVATKLDKDSEEYKRGAFIIRALGWFSEIHGMLPLEGLEYLKPFKVSTFLSTLPLDMPKAQVVEEMTKYCYDKGGSLAPSSQQRHYEVGGKQAKHLYVIGNGFDRYHGAESGYMSFRRYLYRRSPETVGYFDLYFGPRSLDRSFSTSVGWFWCMQPYEYRHNEYGLRYPVATWSRSNLWRDFETNLSELNREKVFDMLDMQLPRVDEGDDDFSYAQFYAPLDEITNAVMSCTFEMKYHFHRWINTLHYAKGFRKKMLDIDKDALFLNFNYTLFLESEYGIPAEQICYIHGCRKDKFGSLILGHHSDDQEAFERWKHKNQNRRRYRHVQKDKKGRYFRNDKLAYLAFFHENDWTGNWRLPIRYYAVEAAEERLEKYYDANFKNTGKIIDAHMGFFDSLCNIEKITIIGCSLGAVDMDYYKQLRLSVKDDAQWEFSYHSDDDRMRIEKFCKDLNIETGCVSTFKM
jgi:hypothetical protein